MSRKQKFLVQPQYVAHREGFLGKCARWCQMQRISTRAVLFHLFFSCTINTKKKSCT